MKEEWENTWTLPTPDPEILAPEIEVCVDVILRDNTEVCIVGDWTHGPRKARRIQEAVETWAPTALETIGDIKRGSRGEWNGHLPERFRYLEAVQAPQRDARYPLAEVSIQWTSCTDGIRNRAFAIQRRKRIWLPGPSMPSWIPDVVRDRV